MGQQQLLLLVVGIVIVGLAVVVGIQAFGENQQKSNADALVNDLVRIAGDAQAWGLRPTVFGGGGGTFLDIGFDALGLSGIRDRYQNSVGDYELVQVDKREFSISACDLEASFDNVVIVTVTGFSADDIEMEVFTGLTCPF